MLRLFSIMYFCMCKVTIRIEFVRSVSILSITYSLRNMIDFIRDNHSRVHNKSSYYSALSMLITSILISKPRNHIS